MRIRGDQGGNLVQRQIAAVNRVIQSDNFLNGQGVNRSSSDVEKFLTFFLGFTLKHQHRSPSDRQTDSGTSKKAGDLENQQRCFVPGGQL